MEEVDDVEQHRSESLPLDEVQMKQLDVHLPQEVGGNQTAGKKKLCEGKTSLTGIRLFSLLSLTLPWQLQSYSYSYTSTYPPYWEGKCRHSGGGDFLYCIKTSLRLKIQKMFPRT